MHAPCKALAIGIILLMVGYTEAVRADGKDTGEARTGIIRARMIADAVTEQGFLDPMAASGAKAIEIHLGTQEAFLTLNGIVVNVYRISSGAPSTPTPLGVFQVFEKEKLRVSKQAVAYRMPNYMAFTENHAFGLHGLPYLGRSTEASAYWREALSHIGIPVSHGCVRFLPEQAAVIYGWADVGTPVIIQN